MRDAWELPQIPRSNTDAMRGAFIKKHGFHSKFAEECDAVA